MGFLELEVQTRAGRSESDLLGYEFRAGRLKSPTTKRGKRNEKSSGWSANRTLRSGRDSPDPPGTM
jgi:hypothetical protein